MRFFTSTSVPLEKSNPNMLWQSCQKFKIPIEPQLWPPDWEGYRNVDRLLVLFKKMPPDEVVFWTDAWDTFYVCGPKEIEKKFTECNAPLVFAAEPGCFQDSTQYFYPNCPTKYKYINGGGFVGRVDALLAMWEGEGFWPSFLKTNQSAYNHWMSIHPGSIALDYDCQIFQCVWGERIGEDIIIENNRVVNKLTKTTPCLIHGQYTSRWEARDRLWIPIRDNYPMRSAIESPLSDHSQHTRREARRRQLRRRREQR